MDSSRRQVDRHPLNWERLMSRLSAREMVMFGFKGLKETKLDVGEPAVTPKVIVAVDNLRLDGKNYSIWCYRMLFYVLKDLTHVLYEPWPRFLVETEASVEEIAISRAVEEIAISWAAEEIWNKNDSLCFHTILNHLSDDLFLHYSKRGKKTSAKQLWHELQSRFREHDSCVPDYLEYHFLEEEPMVEQVEELNARFKELFKCEEMAIDEEFHVNTIISKLPPSWEDVRIELMREMRRSICLLQS
ncbi:uncharacterized protein Pyn_38236 [Prunus yedoensis var. nudiflora]|uniref:Uncharacterized protein n=1 Tax=Prunus yedoensis var. nudiflora TaxID=2094558 RepID=A0A314ZNW3_PRUYE|nr:uncharacterized protein Pyn_38236 [Prunus yedoensis var. nudiflora]